MGNPNLRLILTFPHSTCHSECIPSTVYGEYITIDCHITIFRHTNHHGIFSASDEVLSSAAQQRRAADVGPRAVAAPRVGGTEGLVRSNADDPWGASKIFKDVKHPRNSRLHHVGNDV